jgi:peptide/nickel transport system permease protein
MRRKWLQRLLWALPTLGMVSVLTFLLGQWATDDPLAVAGGSNYTQSSLDPRVQHHFYRRQAQLMGLDQPDFYVSLTTSPMPDTLNRIFPVLRRERLVQLAAATGSWADVQHWEQSLGRLIEQCERLPDSAFTSVTNRNALFNQLLRADRLARCDTGMYYLQRYLTAQTPALRDTLHPYSAALSEARARMKAATGWYWPRLYWQGANNQYHRRMAAMFGGFNSDIWKKMFYPLCVTLVVNLTALLLSVLIALSLAPVLVRYWNRPADRRSKWTLLVLYAMPTLVIGCLLRFLFATPGQGLFLPFIGSVSTTLYNPAEQSFGTWLLANLPKFILPVLTLSLHFGAMLTLQLRNDLLAELQKPYIRTARAKGLPELKIIERHALPNASFSLWVSVGALFPTMIGGVVITESIFNIHGMGELMLNAFKNNDFATMMTIVLLAAVLTILTNLLVDVWNGRGEG